METFYKPSINGNPPLMESIPLMETIPKIKTFQKPFINEQYKVGCNFNQRARVVDLRTRVKVGWLTDGR